MGVLLQFRVATKPAMPANGYWFLQREAIEAVAAVERGGLLSVAPIVHYLRLLRDPDFAAGELADEAARSLEMIVERLGKTEGRGAEWLPVLSSTAFALRERRPAEGLFSS